MENKRKRTVLGQFTVILPPDRAEKDITAECITGPKASKTGDEHSPDIGVDVDIDF